MAVHIGDLAGRRVVAVMARPPLPGAVKTRLAAAVGAETAAAVYEKLLWSTLTTAESLSDVVLAMAIDGGRVGAPSVVRPGWLTLAQRDGSLGERLAAVFTDLFAAGARTVVVVASDTPCLPPRYLRSAVSLLDDAASPVGLVLGPSADGGYYLIGCDRSTWRSVDGALGGLLEASPMSGPRLLRHTVHEADRLGIRVAQLPLWIDVDVAEDLPLMERLLGLEPGRGDPSAGLREIYLNVTHRCGRTCRHCYDRGAAWDPGELTTAEWKGATDQCVALGASSFVFIGGDPLLRDDFIELLDYITGTHQAHVRFFFNSYVDEAQAAELSRAGRGLLRPLASIDGPRDINDALRGPGSHHDVMTSMANLLAVGLEPVANTVLVRPALPGLAQLARELRAAGLSRLHLILPHQRGGLPADLELVPTGQEMLVALRELLAVAAESGLVVDNIHSWRRRLGSRNDFCAAGCRDLAIDPYGNVHACVITAGDPAFVAGSLREQSLATIWRASSSLQLLRAARARDRVECLACPVVDACGGECWVQSHYAARAHNEPAGYRAPFPYCDLVRPMLLELRAEEEARGQTAASDAVARRGNTCAVGACGGQAAAGRADFALFDCI